MVLEVDQHDGWVRHRVAHLFSLGPHPPRRREPGPGALLDLQRMEPESAHSAGHLSQGPRTWLPTERLFRVTGEQRQVRYRRWRMGWWGTDLQPVIHVAG